MSVLSKACCVVSQQEQTKVNFLLVEGAGNEDKPLKIPKEVWILVNRLFTQSCQQVTLWTRPYALMQREGYWMLHGWTLNTYSHYIIFVPSSGYVRLGLYQTCPPRPLFAEPSK
jgi:hypothetical protein